MRAGPLLWLLLFGACSDVSTFTLGHDLEPCESNVPTACTLSAGCVLDSSHYLAGKFPSSRRFVARTAGEATLRIGFLLTDERAPGTELVVTVHEPGCGDLVEWDNGGRDVFRMADSTGVLVVPLTVHRPGDHLVEIFSDAYCAYVVILNP